MGWRRVFCNVYSDLGFIAQFGISYSVHSSWHSLLCLRARRARCWDHLACGNSIFWKISVGTPYPEGYGYGLPFRFFSAASSVCDLEDFYFGEWLPNSFYVKVLEGSHTLLPGLQYVRLFFVSALILIALTCGIRKWQERTVLLTALWTIALLAFYLFVRPLEGLYDRYLWSAFAMLCVLAAIGASRSCPTLAPEVIHSSSNPCACCTDRRSQCFRRERSKRLPRMKKYGMRAWIPSLRC